MVFAAEPPQPLEDEVDGDNDGLVAHQEEILGTSDAAPDTDGDSFDDLVELARGTDPVNGNSVPGPQTVSVGVTGRAADEVVTAVSAIYINYAHLSGFGFEMGASVYGTIVPLPANLIVSVSDVTPFYQDPSGLIVLVETKVPEAYVTGPGYLGLYTMVTEASPPVPSGSQSSVAGVLNLFNFEGVPVMFTAAPQSVQSGTGSIYTPLPRGDDLPSGWASNQICWQLTQQVGVEGSSVTLAVEDASCEDLDSHCNASSCQASIGGSITILDAGALAGGS